MTLGATIRRHALVIGLVGSGAALLGYVALRDRQDNLKALVDATSGQRLVEPRLTGGFTHAPLGRTRSAGTARRHLALDIAALRALRAAEEAPSVINLANAARAALLTGDVERAVEYLEAATREQPQSAELLSDLAAAYLLRARSGTGADTVRALDASLRAHKRSPDLAEAHFNLGLALETNHLQTEANSVWAAYRSIDARSPWAVEAAERIRPDTQVTWSKLGALLANEPLDRAALSLAIEHFPHSVREMVEAELLPDWARLWGDDTGSACRSFERARALAAAMDASGGDTSTGRLLQGLSEGTSCPQPSGAATKGLREYVNARELMTQARFRAARPAFDGAAGSLAGSMPLLAAWSRVQSAYARYQEGDLRGSAVLSEQVATFAQSHAMPALRARALFVRALSLRDESRPDRALDLCAESIRLSEQVREEFHARATARAAADIARSAGDDGESWRLMLRSLASIEQEPSPVRRYLSYFNASLFARSSGLLDAALAFQNAALRSSRTVSETGALAQALAHRAYLNFLLGRGQDAEADLAQARHELGRITASPRAYYEAEMNAIDAGIRMDSDPGRARLLLESVLEVFSETAPERVPDASVALGRASLLAGDRLNARRALMSGIDFFESRRTHIADEDARISFFGTARDLYRDLIALLLADGDTIEAFRYADRVKARALLDWSLDGPARAMTGHDLARVGRAIGPEAVFVSYFVSRGRLISWAVDGLGVVRFEQHRIDVDAVERMQLALRSPSTPAQEERESAAALYDLLLASVRRNHPDVKVFYLAPDGPIHGVPFAQLLNGSNGRRLIEDVTLVIVPSAAWLTTAPIQPEALGRNSLEVLAIGNPALTGHDSSLPPLPAAEVEAAHIAGMYNSSHLLRGATATRSAVLQSAPRARVIHFAGHALQNSVSPTLSSLLLARESDSDDGRLRAPDIAALPLEGTALVVLGACSTATGVIRFGEGSMTLARPFLAAGAASVIATLWDVEDRPTAKLLTSLHRALRQGLTPAAALRVAQLEMLHSSDPSDRLPRHWGGLAVFGTNAPVFNRLLSGDQNE